MYSKHTEKFLGYALTYDDVLVVPEYSSVFPRDTDLTTQLAPNIRLNIPFITAAMDTVTEWEMAIAVAREGGVGFIHKNLSIEEQAQQVRKVKRAESGVIRDPITLSEDATVGDALSIMEEHNIRGIPVVDANGKLKGIVTNRDLRFESERHRPIRQIMTPIERIITAQSDVTLNEAEVLFREHKVEKLPLVDSNGYLRGLITFRDIKRLKEFPHACKDTHGRLRVGAAVGITPDVMERVAELVRAEVDIITVDSAHGHSQKVLETIRNIKNAFPELPIVGGNVATGEGALAVVDAGADTVKVGVGPGSICTTRIIAGIGIPQLQAVFEVSQALKGRNIPIIADGGIRHTGDVVKAIVAGADAVMAGSIFAGVEEAPGDTIVYEGRKFKTYRGMGSIEAMKEGASDRYFQDPEEAIKKLVPEGIVGRVPYKGTFSEVIFQFVGGLRSGMGYTGSRTIAELKQKRFVIITLAGVRESHPHDVDIVRSAPNYMP